MTKDDSAADFLRMYTELTDPEEREKARRLEERRQRIEDRKADTGL